MPLEKMICGENYTVELLKDNVNGLIDSNYFDKRVSNVSDNLLTVARSEDNIPTLGGAVIARDDYDSFELLSTRPNYIGSLSGYATSIAPSGASIQVVQGFYYDGQNIEFQFREIQGDFHLIADGEVVALKSLSSSLNQPRWYKVDFGSAKLRKLYLVSSHALRGGIATEAGSNIFKTRTESISIGVLGDSITGGTGASFGLGFVSGIRWKTKYFDTANYGVGGSGYVNNTATGRFIDRLQEVVDSERDILMVAGGINDLSGSTVSEFSSAVDDFYNLALQSYSGSQIIIISNWGNTATTDGSKTTQFRDVLKSKAEEIGAKFIDAIRDEALGGWVTDANKFNLPDGTHPNNYMHNVYAHNIVASLSGAELIL